MSALTFNPYKNIQFAAMYDLLQKINSAYALVPIELDTNKFNYTRKDLFDLPPKVTITTKPGL